MVNNGVGSYEALMDGVKDNVEGLLRHHDDPVALSDLSKEYVQAYDDELVGAVRPYTVEELQEQYGSLLPPAAGPITPGPALDRLTAAAASASPIFFAQITEAVDRLEAEGRVERKPVGATPRVRYTGPDR